MKFDEIGYNFAVHERLNFVKVNEEERISMWGNTRLDLEDDKTVKGFVFSLEQYLDITNKE